MRLPIYIQLLHESAYQKLMKLWEASGWLDVRHTLTPKVLANASAWQIS